MAGGANPLRARWQAWSERFAALQLREKRMIIGAVAVAIVFLGHSFWIEPGQLQAARLKKNLAQQQSEQEQLRAQLVALGTQNADPDAVPRAELARLQEQLAGTDRDLKTFDRSLVAPKQAPALLQTLLVRHRGLKMVSLATLPPQALIEPPAEKDKTEQPRPVPSVAGSNIYKHGIEIKLAGGYRELLAYVADLEASPQKLLWGDMRLAVKEHPVSELTLTVFTLSLEATWLVV